jgi:hypothetical protein
MGVVDGACPLCRSDFSSDRRQLARRPKSAGIRDLVIASSARPRRTRKPKLGPIFLSRRVADADGSEVSATTRLGSAALCTLLQHQFLGDQRVKGRSAAGTSEASTVWACTGAAFLFAMRVLDASDMSARFSAG